MNNIDPFDWTRTAEYEALERVEQQAFAARTAMANDLDRFKHWGDLKARLKEVRENMPHRTSEEAYAQMERNLALERAEAEKHRPVDTIYITP